MDKDLESYRSQLANDPDDAEALARLEAALVKSGDWGGLIAVTAERADDLGPDEQTQVWERLIESLEAHLETLEDGGAASLLALAVGRIWEDRLERPDEAMLRYQRSFQLDSTHVEALAAARSTYVRQGKWELVLQLYNLQVQATPELVDQATLYIAMADVCANHLDRQDDAAMCVRQALKLSPDHPGAEPYKGLLDSVQRERQGRFDELLATAEATRDPRKRAALKVEAAGLWFDEVTNDDRIEKLLQEVLAADPRNEPARLLLEQYYEVNERWDDLTNFLVARAEGTARKADRLSAYERLAQIATHAQGEEAAVRWHREVLRLSPAEPAALNFCVDFYSRAERWMDLVSVYEAALRTRHRGGNESAMLVQIAMILWKKVVDLQAAEGYFKRIKLNDPRNGLMLVFYAEFYAGREDWKRLLSTLAARQNNEAKLPGKVAIGLEMAEVAEHKLRNLEKAIDIWKSILKLDAAHQGARDALRRLFFDTKKWNALLELLKEDLQLCDQSDTPTRIAIYEEIIKIYRDQLNLPVMVINTYNQILQVDPNNNEALNALQARYTASARWNDLIGILERRATSAAAAGDSDAAVELNREIAKLWLEKFSNPNQAIAYLEAILAQRADDENAIGQLIDIYRHRKDWKALQGIYLRRLPLLSGPARAQLQVEMAQIAADRLSDPDGAIELWRAVLTDEEHRSEASQALDALYQKTSRWAELAELYQARAAALEGEPAQVGWLKKLAGVQSDRLSDEDAAAQTWHAVLTASPGDFHAESFLRELYRGRNDWDALQSLYGDRGGDWEGYIRLLSTAADESNDVSVKVDLYRRMANVCLVNMENESAAVECWERVLGQDPDHLEAARTLAPYYEANGSWERLVGVHEVVLRSGPEEPVDLMVEMAKIHDEQRGDMGQAYLWYARALQSEPARPDLLTETRRMADASDSRELLVELLEALVGGVESAETEVRIRQVLAETCSALGRRAEAAAHYERVRALGGDSPEVLNALTTLYKQLGQWDELYSTYEVQLDRADEPQAQTAILANIGELHETVRDDVDAARAAYDQLRALDPESVDALRGLQRLAERTDDRAALAELVEAELALTSDSGEIASLRFRLGQLAERDGRMEEAAHAYADVLGETPDHIGAVRALEGFLDGPLAPRAAAILEPYMRAHEEWSSLRTVLELQVAGSQDPGFRARLLREVAEIREHRLSDAHGAFQSYQQLLQEDRGDGSVRAALERLANERGSWDALAEHYARFAIGGDLSLDDPDAAATYSKQLARIQEERLAQFEAARESIRAVLVEQGDDRATLDVVDRLSARLEDWPALVDVAERKLALTESTGDRVELLFRIADLHEEMLNDSEAAVDVYRRVLGEDADNARAVAALERIFRNTRRDQDLADLLESRLESADDEARIALGYQLAQVLAYPLGRPADALDRYAEVLTVASDHHPTLEAIEEMLVDGGDDPQSQSLRARGCQILAPIYRERGDWQNSIHLLQVRLSDAQDISTRVDLLSQIAALHESQGDLASAFNSYSQAFGEDYGNPTVLAALERLGAERGQWDELAAVLRQGVDEEDRAALLAPDLRSGMLRRIARLYEEKLGELNSSISFNQRVLDEDPTDAKALESLDRLYTANGDVESLAEVVGQRMQQTMDPDEQAQLGFRLGSLCEDRLDDPQRAVDVFVQIRQVDPTDLRAHVALERLYTQVGDFGALVEVLADHADQTEDEAEKKALLYKAATVYEEALDRPESAVEVYRRLVELNAEDRVALSHLDRLYGRLERHIDLLEVLERESALAQDEASRDDFEYRLGRLLWKPVGEMPRAVSTFRAVLERNPNHAPTREALEALLAEPDVRLEVARLLVPLYESDEAWRPLRDTLRGTLEDLLDPKVKVETLERIATIEEAYLDEPQAAFDSLSQAFDESEAAPRLEHELERLAEGLGAHEAFANLLGGVVGVAPARAIELHLKVAAISEVQLGDVQRAIDEHRAVLHIDPESTAALGSLERLYGASGDHAALVEIVERQAELADTPEARKPLYQRIAQMQEDALDDHDSAVETWRRVLADDEAELTAQENLERLLGRSERWPELAALLEHRMSTSEEPSVRAEVEFRLAGVLEQRLAEGQRAVELYRNILTEAPDHGGSKAALAALFGDPARADAAGADRLVVAEILEPIYRESEDHTALVPVLALRQNAQAHDPAARVELLREVMRLQERSLGNADAAFEAGLTLLSVTPEEVADRRDLLRLAGQTGRYSDLARALDDTAADTPDPDLKVALLMELAAVQEQHLNDDVQARDGYREVLEIIPGHPPAVDALRELFARTASWEELVQLHLDLAENSVDPEEKKTLYFRVCQLLEDVVDDNNRAIETYRLVLEIEPDNAQALKALERFYTQESRWADLAELLRDEIRFAQDDAERASLHFRLGELLESRLDDLEGAIEVWSVVLADGEDNHQPTLEALERLLVELEEEDEQRRRVARILEPIYADQGQWSDWIGALEVQLTFEEDRWARLEVLTRIAKVHEDELDAPAAAFSAYAQAFSEDYGNPDLQVQLDRLAEELGAWQALVDTYLGGIEELQDLDAAVTILLKVADTFDGKLEDPQRAIDCYRRVLLVDEANAHALDALERILAAEGLDQELVKVLTRKADFARDLDVKKALYFRVSEIWEERLDRPDQAIETYRLVFQDDPSDAKALDALIRLYARTSQWERLVEVQREKLELVESDAEKKALLYGIAGVFEEQLNDPDETILTWRSVLEMEATDGRAIDALERLYSRERRFGELIDLLEQERDQAEGDDRVNSLDLRIAEVLAQEMDQVAQAIEIYSTILERDSTNPQARKALERLLGDEEHRLLASRALEPHYSEDEPESLARIYELQLLDVDDPGERLQRLRSLAELQYSVLQHPRGAFESYSRAFQEEPADASIVESLHQLADELKSHGELATLYRDQVAATLDGEVVRDINRRLARLYDGKLGDQDQAIQTWQAVMSIDPYDIEGLEALDRLYQTRQAWPELIDVLRRRIEVTDGEEVHDLQFRLGYLLEVVDNDVAGALEQYRTVLYDRPEHAYSLEALERLAIHLDHRREIAEILDPIYRDANQWDKLAILTEMRIELSEDPRDQARLWRQSAEIRAEELKDKPAALESLARAFEAAPDDEDIRVALIATAGELGSWAGLADAFESNMSKIHDLDLKLEDHLRIAKWSIEHLDDHARAVGHYRIALEIDPTNNKALEALESLYRGASAWDELAAIYQAKSQAVFDLDEKRKWLHRLGDLCADALGDTPAAVNAYEEALDIDENDTVALAALESLHTRTESWPALLAVLERKSESIYDGVELAKVHRRIGDLARNKMGDPQRAAEAYEKVVELDPDAAEVTGALRELYVQSESWNRLQEVLVKELAECGDDEDARVALLKALGENAEQRLGNPDSAMEYHRQVLTLRPDDREAAQSAFRLFAATERWFDLVEAMREHFVAVRETSSEEERVELLVKIASVAEERLGDADLAIETLNEVLEAQPDHVGALTVLARLHERSGDWAQATATLERALAQAEPGPERAIAWRRLGLLYLERLNRPEDAERALRSAVEEGQDPEAAEALLDIVRARGDFASAVELVEMGLATATGDARIKLLREVAELRGQAGDPAGRISALEEASALAPTDLDLTDAVLEAYFDADRHDEAEPILVRTIDALKAKKRFKDVFRYNFRLGVVAESRGDDEGALQRYTEVFEYDATFVPNLVRLGKLRFRLEDWDNALRAFQTVLLHQMKLEPADRVDVFYHLGRVREALGDTRKAKDMFNRALGLDPSHTASREALDAL